MDNQTLLQAALDYAENFGWFLFPVRETFGKPYFSHKKQKIVTPEPKSPYVSSGVLSATRDLDKIRAWWKKYPNAGIGVNCSKSRLFVIDLDNHKEVGNSNGTGHANFMKLGIPWQGAWQAITPSGGFHLIYSDPDDIGVISTNEHTQIDTRAKNSYFIAPHSWYVDKNGKKGAYIRVGEWNPNKPPMNVTPLILSKLGLDRREEKDSKPIEKIDFGNQKFISDIAKALDEISEEYADNYQDWIKIGIALKPLEDVGLYLWDSFSKKSSKYDETEIANRWETFPVPEQITYKSIFWYRNQSRNL